ncbi:hypothetical protein FNV43_RR07255 [Rhamnella rubrinervis]|uniref:UBC core domain-containing protein n=1 Tax=Rhamnella rubrinervis TaxID=2594499 RepID=A0A8K0MMI9_9ROSA|nr:hypothetical protein FNV43_RR07255 [Rhamnella rubrinervis]
MGRVISIDMLVDLENVHGKMVKNVNSKHLLKIRSISIGDYVVCGAWVGRVNKVVDRLTVVFDDGTKCEITAQDQEKLLPISPNILEDSQYPYYPGQRIQVKVSTVSKSAGWLCGTWKENQDEGTLGDWCLLPISDHEAVAEQAFHSDSTRELITNRHKKLESGFKRRGLSSNVDEIFVIVKTKTKVDVEWQDGSNTLGLDSKTLLPVNVANAHEFWPEQFVMDKGNCDDPHISCSLRWGVVQGVDAKERTVKVQWKTITSPQANDLDGEQMVETVSAYELVEHPDYSYCFGDFVFKLGKDQFGGQGVKGYLNAEVLIGEEGALQGKNLGSDNNEFSDKLYLSSIGNVTGFRGGFVEVKWAAGITSKVAPYEIFRIDKNEGSAAVSMEEDVEDLSQEMNEFDKNSSQKGRNSGNIIYLRCLWHLYLSTHKVINSVQGLVNSDVGGEGCNKSLGVPVPFPSKSCHWVFTSIAASLLGSLGSTSVCESLPLVHISEVEKGSGISSEKEVLETSELCIESHPMAELEIFDKKRESEEFQLGKDLPHSTSNENPNNFRQFDMIPDCPDHHFLGASEGLALAEVRRTWLKKVQQEWNILEKSLPEYPHEPPMVHYISGGLRVNPNLYESGKVCLSLLNTWTGKGTEVWNPGSSTILQVLLSLQALVLNEKPYFNEAGYDQQMGRAEGEKNSVSYNENAFLMTCKSMLYLLRKPPKHYEALVEEHFSQRSQYILMACKSHMEGAPVGCDAEFGQNEYQKGGSTGFKIMLGKLLVKLLEAFLKRYKLQPIHDPREMNAL